MSADAYKVAVRISLVENVTRGLSMMARHFKTTDAEAAALEARLKSIGKLAMVGGALAGAGAFGLSLFKKPIEEAMEYERRLGSLRQMGIGDAQIADARKFVQATNIIGESMNDRMRLFVDAQGSFRQSGMGGAKSLDAAKMMMPILGTYEAATKMLSGDKRSNAEMAMRSLNKTIEIMGGLTDTNRAKAIADGVFKASQSSGGMVDERQLKQFVAYGSSATNQLDLRTIFGGLEPLIGELGGSTAAVGLRTAYTRTNGMMSLPPKRMVAEMARLGMLKGGTRQQTDDLARMQATHVIDYAQQIMQRYASHGITNRTDIERENAIIFGTNGSKIYNKLMSQMPVIRESQSAYDKAQGASGVLNDPGNRMLKAQMDLEAKEADLKIQIGQVILPKYVKALEKLRDLLVMINGYAEANKGAFKIMVELFAATSAVALVGGSLSMLVAGFRAFALLAPVLAPLGTAILFIGRALLLNPIGLILTAIAVAAYEIYNNWNVILPALKNMWAGIKSGFFSMINFVIDLINHLPGVKISHVGGSGTGSSPYVAPSWNGVTVHTSILMDTGKVAHAVTKHQTKAANSPNTGTSGFNPMYALPSVAGGR